MEPRGCSILSGYMFSFINFSVSREKRNGLQFFFFLLVTLTKSFFLQSS